MAAALRQRVREDPVVRRRQIVDAAMQVIGQHGFNGFTVQLLAAKCGLSNAGLLYYFGSKDALLIALLDEVERQDTEVLGPLVTVARQMPEATPESLRVRLGLLRRIVELFVERPEIGRFAATLQSESLDPTHPAHDWFRARQAAALDLFKTMMTGLVDDPAMTARLLMAQLYGLQLQWLRDGRAFDVLAAWDQGVRVLARLPEGKGQSA